MLSVIIPVYNVEQYLDNCIKSVLELDIKKEIILVNDGSTDYSGKLCEQWAQNEDDIYVIHQSNQGLSEARNTGIRSAHGDYIMFLDSDDFLNSRETMELFGSVSRSPEIIVGLYNKFYEDREIFEKEHCDELLNIEGFMQIEDFLAAIVNCKNSCHMIACRFIIKRSFLLSNNLFFKSGIYHEDEEWSHRLFYVAQNIFITHYFFYQYRQMRKGSIMASFKIKHTLDKFLIIESAKQLLQSLQMSPEKEKYLQNRVMQLYVSNMLDWSRCDMSEKKKVDILLNKYYSLCMKKTKGFRYNIIKVLINIIGIHGTCVFLEIITKLKSK